MPTGYYVRKPPIIGEKRAELRKRVARRYEKDYASIRTIAAEIGRSYGLVWTLLGEAQVQLRPPNVTGGTGRRSAATYHGAAAGTQRVR